VLERRWAPEPDYTFVDLRNRDQQCDPHEFLNRLVESLQTDPAENERIGKLFFLKYVLSSICLKYDKTRTAHDDDLGLGLPLSNRSHGKRLTKYLAEHFNEGMMHTYKFESDHCRARDMPGMDQPEGRRILQPPQILVIQLKRMKFIDLTPLPAPKRT